MSDDQAREMRPETTSEHIARDMREGRFPEQSERQMVPVLASLPHEIQVWRSMDTLDHIGTWSTTRYPAEAVTYVSKADAQAAVAREAGPTFYIDCEFDGHNGPLLSIAIVREDGANVYVTAGAVAEDPWVIANVLPWMNCHDATDTWHVRPLEVGTVLRNFIGLCKHPVIIADSPVDIARFCQAISTGEDGGWASADFPGMTFEVRNVDCYPTALEGAVQHNAWWDAMALRAALAQTPTDPGDGWTTPEDIPDAP